MEQAHRKIELQAPADLTYLLNNASRRARERIDVHFPPANNEPNVTAATNTGDANATSNSTSTAASSIPDSESAVNSLASVPASKSTGAAKDSRTDGEVDMRTRVEELVEAYIDDTFRAVRGNVSVNGLDGSDLDALMSSNQAEGTFETCQVGRPVC